MPAPSLCTITGTLYKSNGDVWPYGSFLIGESNGESQPVGSAYVTVTADGSGAVSFTAIRGFTVWLKGKFRIGDYSFTNGLEMYVPDQASLDFTSLQSWRDALRSLTSTTISAPADAKYIVQTANASLSNAQALGALGTGMLKNTTTTGVLSIATASDLPLISTLTADASPDGAADYVLTYDASANAHKKVLLNNLPGGGGGGTWGSITGTLSSQTDLQAALDLKAALISPSFTTPTLGVASATSINKVTLTAPATGSTLTIADGKTLTASNTITLTATDGSTLAIGAGGTLGSAAYTASSAYEVPLTFSTGLTRSTNTITVDTSVIATKSYADSLVVGLLDDRGNYDASGNVFPSSGGSGTAGAVLKGDLWTISVAGTLGGAAVTAGDLVRALVDTPGQTASNWAVSETNIGYTALNASLSSGQIYIGNASNVGTARTLSGDVTVSNTGVTAIGATKVTSAMLNADVFSTAHSWGGQQTFTAPILGTPASGTLTSCTGLPPTTGISGWPDNASGVLTNNGSGTLSWAAAGSGITIDSTAITSGKSHRVLFESATNNVSEAAGFTFDGTSALTLGVAGTSVGSVAFKNATSGTITVQPVTGALGTVTLSLPATTSTLAGLAIAQTFSAAQTFSDVISLSSTTAANNKITQGAAINIGTTSTDGIILQNTTAAAVGAQQYSPRLRLTGSGWKTNATAAAQTVDWIVENQPVQGAAAPTTNLTFASQVNAGGYTTRATLDSAGVLTLPGSGSYILLDTASGGSSIIRWGSATGRGMVPVNNGVGLVNSSNEQFFSNQSGTFGRSVAFYSTALVGWAASGGAEQTTDLNIRRAAAANLAFGATDAASPVAQTLSVQNVVAGTTNTAGATWTHTASLGTSQGAPGRFHIQTGGMIAASGSTRQTAVDRAIFGATKVLTNNSATTVANITVASNTSAGGTLDYVVEVFDGTDLQYETGTVAFGVTNKGGAFSGNTTTKAVNQQNATSGTLTVTWAISGANPGVLSVNANSSLTPSTGYPRVTYNLRSGSQQSISIQ